MKTLADIKRRLQPGAVLAITRGQGLDGLRDFDARAHASPLPSSLFAATNH